MLRENPQHRPNIYQVVAEVCSMRHRAIPIKDVRYMRWFKSPILRHFRSTLAEHNLKPGATSSCRLRRPRSPHRLPL
jgi:hypothetical protein